VFNGQFHGSHACAGTARLEVFDGFFHGPQSFERCIEPHIQGGRFLGHGAFALSRGAKVAKGQFAGSGAFREAKDAEVSGGLFSGAEPFGQSVNVRVWGGQWSQDGQPRLAFQHALNPTVCIQTGLESVDSPVNGVFVAKQINSISKVKGGVNSKSANFYVADSKGKHDPAYHSQIRKISVDKLAAVSDPALFDRKYLLNAGELCYKRSVS